MTLEVLLLHWKPRTLLVRLALPLTLLGGGAGALFLTLPASAGALPVSNTQCYGSLTNDPSGPSVAEPDLTDYQFSCTTPITAYTILANRVRSDGNNIDDYSPTASVLLTQNGTADTTTSVNCGGATPSNGINCYSLVGATAGPVPAYEWTSGAIDLTDQYCSYIPKGAKPGTPAVPRATVQVVVTDNTGAQDGPFDLSPAKACPKVPAVAPAAKPTVKKTTKTTTKKKVATKKTAAAKSASIAR